MSNFNRSSNVVAPCKDCERRKVGCHATCDAYSAFKEKVSDWNRNRSDANFQIYKGSDFVYDKRGMYGNGFRLRSMFNTKKYWIKQKRKEND